MLFQEIYSVLFLPAILILLATSFHLRSLSIRLRKFESLLSQRHGLSIKKSIKISSCDTWLRFDSTAGDTMLK